LLLLFFSFFFFFFFFYRAPAANAPGRTAAWRLICTLCFGSSHLHRQAPPRLQQETSSRERGNYGREITGNFAYNGDFHATVGIFYMPQICDMGPTALLPLLRRHVEDFFALKKSDGLGRVRTRELGYQRQACYL
jgi:hypothetical protein